MAPDDMFPTVHPRVFAQAAMLRANVALQQGRKREEREAMLEAIVWYMVCANEGWDRIRRTLLLDQAKLKRWRQKELLKLPMHLHTPEHCMTL